MAFFFLCLLSLVACALSGWETPLENTAKISSAERERMSKQAVQNMHEAAAPIQPRVASLLAAEANAGVVCPSCGKDYSDPCPLGWTESNDGTCKAPAIYGGVCSDSQFFLGSSVATKMENEIICGVCWPCIDGANQSQTCLRDWARPCPHGYYPQNIQYPEYAAAPGITCAADVFYEGECEQQVVFNDIESKHAFARRCRTSWPCASKCEDVLSTCPQDWQRIGGGLCVAPSWYKKSGCPLLQSFRGWTRHMKFNFSDACDVEWRCLEDADIDEEECKELNVSACPRDWLVKPGDLLCYPPQDARGACAEPLDRKSLSEEEKIRWASDCGIEWPCMGERVTAGKPSVGPRVPAHISTELSGPIDHLGRIAVA